MKLLQFNRGNVRTIFEESNKDLAIEKFNDFLDFSSKYAQVHKTANNNIAIVKMNNTTTYYQLRS